jgi:hypothetical protein
MEPKELTPSEFSALWHDAGNAARIAEEASNRHDALTFYRVSDQQKALADALRAHFTAVELRKMKEKADEALLSLLPTPGEQIRKACEQFGICDCGAQSGPEHRPHSENCSVYKKKKRSGDAS